MKKILVTALFLISSLFHIQGQEKESYEIAIAISGMKSNQGKVYVALYNSEKSFLTKGYKGAVVGVFEGKASVVFKNLPKGVYAVSVFHDKNNNKKLDTNFLGIPREPTGCSNGAKGFMGPPKYKKAKFIITKNTNISIHLK